MSWYAAPSPVRAAFEEEPLGVDEHRTSLSKTRSWMRIRPSLIQPAQTYRSLSPILPPVPHNPWRTPGLRPKDLDMAVVASVDLSRMIFEQEEDFHSEASSVTATSPSLTTSPKFSYHSTDAAAPARQPRTCTPTALS